MRIYRRITPAGLFSVLLVVALLAPAPAQALNLTAGTQAELVNAINQANDAPTEGHKITLTADISLTASTPAIHINTFFGHLVIDGDGFKIDGQDQFRPLTIEHGNVSMKNITLTRGRGHLGGGIHIASLDHIREGNVHITDCTFRENYATGGGGGIYIKNSRVYMTNCKVIEK